MKEYWKETQKWKVIRILLANPQRVHQVEDFMQYTLNDLFVWYEAWSRLSELKKDWIVTHEVFERKNKPDKFGYIIKKNCIEFYTNLYAEQTTQNKGFMEKIWLKKKSE